MSSKSLTAFAASGGRPQFGAFSHADPKSARQIRRAETAGKYKLGRRIALGDTGASHFGVVSGAAHASRVVAIKRLPAQPASNQALVERFQSEARITGRVRDPHVVRLLDFVECDGELWQVHEYVDGETLLALQTEVAVWGRQLPINVSVAIMVGALRGLHATHSARHETGLPLGVVHRAVTPASLMIARSGQVKIIGFGSAKTKRRSSSSDVAHLDGRVGYLSPEQVRRAAVDQRSDLFAAGVVLWEALTGRSLFGDRDETEALILDNIENQPIPTPSSLRKEIPGALDKVVLRALQRGVAHRFDSALEFARALEESVPPASEAQVGAYLSVYCEARLARREQLIRAIESSAPELDEIGARARSVQAPDDEDEDEDEDEDDEPATLLAIPSSAMDSSVRQLGSTGKPAPVQPRDRTLWVCAAAFALLVLTCIGWRILRPVPTISWPAPSPARTAALLAPMRELAAKPRASARADSDGEWSVKAAEIKAAELKAAEAATLRSPRTSPQGSGTRAAPPRGVPAANQSAPRAAMQPTRAQSSADCTPPTYLGTDGIHHFKENCL